MVVIWKELSLLLVSPKIIHAMRSISAILLACTSDALHIEMYHAWPTTHSSQQWRTPVQGQQLPAPAHHAATLPHTLLQVCPPPCLRAPLRPWWGQCSVRLSRARQPLHSCQLVSGTWRAAA